MAKRKYKRLHYEDRLIHAGNLQEVQNAIFKSFYRGTAGDNSDTENENDGEETTEEGNRAAVQEN